jgi:hypothetical protein
MPPARLAAEIPLGFLEAHEPRRGALTARLSRAFGAIQLQSMALAALLAARGQGETSIVTRTLGRLPLDRSSLPIAATAAGGWNERDVRAHIALLAPTLEVARPTAEGLFALTRVGRAVQVGALDAVFCLLVAFAAAAAGRGLRPGLALACCVPLAMLAVAAPALAAMRGHPILLAAPLFAVVVAGAVMTAARSLQLARERSGVREALRGLASRALATDLIAAPEALTPGHRTLAVLVIDRTSGSHALEDPALEAAAIEAFQRRVLGIALVHSALFTRVTGDRMVAVFGALASHDLAQAHVAALAANVALELAAADREQVAIGMDVGPALCGLFGPLARYQAVGSVVDRAERAARVAAQGSVPIAATETALRTAGYAPSREPLSSDPDLLVFPMVSDDFH